MSLVFDLDYYADHDLLSNFNDKLHVVAEQLYTENPVVNEVYLESVEFVAGRVPSVGLFNRK